MKSLFQNIRTGVITKAECEAQLNRFKIERQDLVGRLARKGIGRELFGKEIDKLNFSITLLEYLVNVFDDLKLPLKVLRKDNGDYGFWD